MSEIRLAIMQPYWFPYWGYFQLMAAVDRFVVYDDVTFIKQGWINRNRILRATKGGASETESLMLTLPLQHASSFTAIDKTLVVGDETRPWRRKMLATVAQNYAKAPFRDAIYAMFEANLALATTSVSVSTIALDSLKRVWTYLGCSSGSSERPYWVASSRQYHNDFLCGQERVLDIVRQEGGRTYVNAIGGQALYTPRDFDAAGVKLQFCAPRFFTYPQSSRLAQSPNKTFTPGLSILDVLMWNSPATIKTRLTDCELVTPLERPEAVTSAC